MKKLIAGVDESGRGSLIGPVLAAAVILKDGISKAKIRDSKSISKKNREILEKYIKKNSIWSIGSASIKEIERLNILNATMLAMKRAIKKLEIKPDFTFIDGNKIPEMPNYKIKYIIKGDEKITEISAASIIAKVTRDRMIEKMSKKFNGYFWNKNFGYCTKEHIKAIKKLGITSQHRRTFKPIYNMLGNKKLTTQ